MAALLCGSTAAVAQQPAWQPQRLPSTSAATQLSQGSTLRPASQSGQYMGNNIASNSGQSSASQSLDNDSEKLGSGVVLRWKKPNSSSASNTAGTSTSNQLRAQQAFEAPQTVSASVAFQRSAVPSQVRQASGNETRHAETLRNQPRRIVGSNANPLRNDAWVQTTSYQQEPGEQSFDPFGQDLPALPGANDGNLQDGLPELPSMQGDGLTAPPQQPLDPLAVPEQAPVPNSAIDPRLPPNPFPDKPRIDATGQDPSPFDRNPAPERLELAEDPTEATREELDAPMRNQSNANSISCNEQRNRAKDLPLRDISLDVSPAYGEGLRSILKDTEKERLDFAASSVIRDWSDYTGKIIATGRLVDLRNDRVILDVNGSERALLLQDLSDVDVAYVGISWNIPTTCGTGYERFVGRNFTPSTVQWTASGLSNKPLYFEQVQLERYGHEAGPIIQPIVSTAHFFGNIAVLPYKMGIHPPNECQYSLGYIRPGNCAPYMLQPIPLSLRGALMQAGAVTGAAALVP